MKNKNVIRRHQKRKFALKVRRSNKARLMRQLDAGYIPWLEEKKKLGNRPSVLVVRAPKVFLLASKSTNKVLLGFIDALRKAAHAKPKTVHVKFSDTMSLHSCGTLLFVAELDRLKRVIGDSVKFTCSYPNVEKVEKVLQQIGAFSLFNKRHRLTVTEDDEDVFHWRYCTATDADPTDAVGFMDEINTRLAQEVGLSLGSGIGEAMTNCAQHAYPSEGGMKKGREKRWWMFGEVVESNLFVVFCDLGIGIPASLRKNWKEALSQLYRAPPRVEGKIIEAAFEVGRTRTNLDKQGKGMNDLKTVIDSARAGNLIVYSNKGRFSYKYEDGNVIKRVSGFPDSINGTLIQWSIPVSEVHRLN